MSNSEEFGIREGLLLQIDNILSGVSEGVAKKYQSKAGGLNDKGRAHFNRQGHKLKKPVTKKQAGRSKKSAGRRKSFCSRMGGQKRMHNIDCRKNPDKDICRALKRWDCSESFDNKLDIVLEDYTIEIAPTVQIQNTLSRLVAHHGYSAVFVRDFGEGIYLYNIGGYYYRIRGDGTII
jgi:hypothetical protein